MFEQTQTKKEIINMPRHNNVSDETAILEDKETPMEYDDPYEFERDLGHISQEEHWQDNDCDVFDLVDLEPPFIGNGEPEYDFGDGYS